MTDEERAERIIRSKMSIEEAFRMNRWSECSNLGLELLSVMECMELVGIKVGLLQNSS